MLCFTPQSTSTTRFGFAPLALAFSGLYSMTCLQLTCATQFTPSYSASGTTSGMSSKRILPIITPCSRNTFVSSRVSMPVMPGTCSRLSHSARLSQAFQWECSSL